MATRVGPQNFSDGTIFVTGLEDINRAFRRIDAGLARSVSKSLKKAAEPVRQDAQALAPQVIRNLRASSPWTGVRTGTTQRTVYIAPTERGRTRDQRKKRPNFKTLMLERAYEPALDHNREKVAESVGNDLFGDIVDAWSA